jgi:hypothetical protein
MRKRQRFAFLAIGGLGLLAAVAPGLAAGIQTPSGTDVPAAGQGVVQVEGFHVCNINWVIDETSLKVTRVTFRIERDSDGGTGTREACGDSGITSTVSAAAAGNAENTVLRVQLQEANEPHADWAGCSATDGAAVCDLAGGAQMLAEDLDRVNIIAFDRN